MPIAHKTYWLLFYFISDSPSALPRIRHWFLVIWNSLLVAINLSKLRPWHCALNARKYERCVRTFYHNLRYCRLRGASGKIFSSQRLHPEFASRSFHVGFVVDEWFFWGFSHFPRHKFHSDILANHRPLIMELHRISSIDPALCRTRVCEILY